MYLSIGEGTHIDEIRFSVLTAARFLGKGADWNIALYADRTAPFEGLPVEFRPIEEAQAAEWRGAQGYVYRSKILALADSLRRPGVHKSAIIDGDTYFQRSPAELFSRLEPGVSLMHVREGRPAPPEVAALRHVLSQHEPVDSAGRSWELTTGEPLWNSGVVGLRTDNAHLCDEALNLTDQLLRFGYAEHSHIAEMLAFGSCLSRRSALRECFDVVAHYWPAELREPFQSKLQGAWTDETLDDAQRLDLLWQQRPREKMKRRMKFVVRRAAWRAGIEL